MIMKRMNVYKSLLILLLAALIVFLGAGLPKTVAAWQERNDDVSYAAISPVELTLKEESFNIVKKLSIFSKGDGLVEVPEAMASKTVEEIRDIFTQTLDRYMQAGLIRDPGADAEGQIINCIPYLAIDEERAESYLCWYASLITPEAMWSLVLYIDDETGTVINVGYYDRINEQPHPETALLGFSEIYLQGLGGEFAGYDPADILADAEYYSASMISGYINWGDTLYGEIIITFWINESGFYTLIT